MDVSDPGFLSGPRYAIIMSASPFPTFIARIHF